MPGSSLITWSPDYNSGPMNLAPGARLGPYEIRAPLGAVHVPPQSGDGIASVIARTAAGQATYLLAPIPLAMADIRAGRLRALGVSTRKRSPLLPEVPTIAEAGVPNFEYAIWYGIWAPAGTAQEIVDQLGKDIALAMATPDLHDWLAEHGAEPISMSQSEFADLVRGEIDSASRI